MNTNTELTLQAEDTVESFIALMRDVASNLTIAAGMLARLHAADPDVLERIRTQAPALSPGFLGMMLRVGEKSLHPDLLTNSCQAYGRIRLMPYSAQESLLRAGSVPVVTDIETGDCLRVPLVELKGDQLTQALSPTGLRPIDEQRAWLRRKLTFAPKPVARTDALPWQVKKDKVIIGGVELGKRDLLHILEEMA